MDTGEESVGTGPELTDAPSSWAESDRRVYGRRIGRTMKPSRRNLIDRLLPSMVIKTVEEQTAPSEQYGLLRTVPPIADATALFDKPVDAVWLEIGFGGGEHLAAQAAAHPNIGFIGCEFFMDGVASLLAHTEEMGVSNIRLHVGDARLLTDALPEASLDRVFVLFPDPWPKKKHWRRRLVSTQFLDRLAYLIKPGGELRMASDEPSYISWMLEHTTVHPCFTWQAQQAADWRKQPKDWVQTRYETKALREGRQPAYLRFRRNSV